MGLLFLLLRNYPKLFNAVVVQVNFTLSLFLGINLKKKENPHQTFVTSVPNFLLFFLLLCLLIIFQWP